MRISRTFNRAVTSSGATLYLTDEEVAAGKTWALITQTSRL